MTAIQTAHTGELDAEILAAGRALLEEVFEEGLDEHDWEHALGGMHALAWEDGVLVGHASVIQRRRSTARGWRVWAGPTSALTLGGIERTAAEDGGIYVLPGAAPLDLAGELTCDWRDGDLW
jgi:aminoglycoside 2'-N-acetyltransferase I